MSACFDEALETHQKKRGTGVRERKSGSRLLNEVKLEAHSF